jgi:superfamily I DNA/RNA helicase
LIVDEAQDISLAGYLDVLDLSLAKGFSSSSVMFFGDFKYQGVYVPGDISLENLKNRIPEAIEFQPLSINCRNTKQIGDTVMQLIGDKGAYSSYRRKEVGKPPTLIALKEGDSTLKNLREQLARLEKNFELENIVVLSSNKSKLFELLEKTGLPLTDLAFKQRGKLRWGTSQAFKGMEAPAVVLVEFEDGYAASKETFYVAGTRATAEWVCIMPSKVIKALLQGEM